MNVKKYLLFYFKWIDSKVVAFASSVALNVTKDSDYGSYYYTI